MYRAQDRDKDLRETFICEYDKNEIPKAQNAEDIS